MVRVTKPTGSIFLHNIPKWLTFYASYLNKIANFKHWISWDAPTAPMGKSLQPAHYGILFYTKETKGAKINELRHPHKRDRKQGFLLKDYGGKKDNLHPFGPLISDVWTDIHRIKHNKKRDPHYVKITESKLELTQPNYKIGDIFVSFYLGEVVTIRDKDWEKLKPYFIIPEPTRNIDFEKIKLKDNPILPEDDIITITNDDRDCLQDNLALFQIQKDNNNTAYIPNFNF